MGITRVTPEGEAWTAKPRPVFWEWFFLDANSDFRRTLRQLSRVSWDEILGGLTVYTDDCYATGLVRSLQPRKIMTSLAWFRRFGFLVSFASTFGWGRVRGENLIGTGDFVQLLELDEVFGDLPPVSDFVSSLETLTARSMTSLKLEELFAMIEGLRLGFQNLHLVRPQLLEFFQHFQSRLIEQPVRAWVRAEEVYQRVAAGGRVPPGLIPSELASLSRGEIPYFIYYPLRDGMVYSKSAGGEWSALVGIKKVKPEVFLTASQALNEARLRRLEKMFYEDWASRFVSPETFRQGF